jgi:hypothetical protein
MFKSHVVVLTSSKAEGLCYLHVEDVESIGASGVTPQFREDKTKASIRVPRMFKAHV